MGDKIFEIQEGIGCRELQASMQRLLDNKDLMGFFNGTPVEELYKEFKYFSSDEPYTGDIKDVVNASYVEVALGVGVTPLSVGAYDYASYFREDFDIDLSYNNGVIDNGICSFIGITMLDDASLFNQWFSEGSRDDKLAIIEKIYEESFSYSTGKEKLLEQIKNDLSPEDLAYHQARKDERMAIGMSFNKFSLKVAKGDTYEIEKAMQNLEATVANAQYYNVDMKTIFDQGMTFTRNGVTIAYIGYNDVYGFGVADSKWYEEYYLTGNRAALNETEDVNANIPAETEEIDPNQVAIERKLENFLISNIPAAFFEIFEDSDQLIKEIASSYESPDSLTEYELHSIAKEIWQKMMKEKGEHGFGAELQYEPEPEEEQQDTDML